MTPAIGVRAKSRCADQTYILETGLSERQSAATSRWPMMADAVMAAAMIGSAPSVGAESGQKLLTDIGPNAPLQPHAGNAEESA